MPAEGAGAKEIPRGGAGANVSDQIGSGSECGPIGAARHAMQTEERSGKPDWAALTPGGKKGLSPQFSACGGHESGVREAASDGASEKLRSQSRGDSLPPRRARA